ncbi:MAG: hypothetical protein WAU91_00905 [Desulfatitalea sp.]
MDASQDDIPKITPTSTKKEMHDAYKQLIKKIEDRSKTELKPERVKQDRQVKETVQAAETIASDSVSKRLGDLKIAIDKELSDLALTLEAETHRFKQIKSAIEMKDNELQEIFEIERNAHTLAALLESQKQKKAEFETDMAENKQRLEEDIQQTRARWEREKQQHQDALKEQKQAEEKSRKREKEENDYNFNRDQALQKAKLNDELETLTKEVQKKRVEFDQHVADTHSNLQQREKIVTEREQHVDHLEARVAAFPQELEAKLAQAVKAAVDSVKSENSKNEQLLKKGFEGEKNVLQTRINAMEQTVASQARQIDILTQQLEKAYEKVQDIAVKAVSRSQTVTTGNQRGTTPLQTDNA